MNETILKIQKYIKSAAFREYSLLQAYSHLFTFIAIYSSSHPFVFFSIVTFKSTRLNLKQMKQRTQSRSLEQRMTLAKINLQCILKKRCFYYILSATHATDFDNFSNLLQENNIFKLLIKQSLLLTSMKLLSRNRFVLKENSYSFPVELFGEALASLFYYLSYGLLLYLSY